MKLPVDSKRSLVCILAALACFSPSLAMEHPNLADTFNPTSAYSPHGLDTIGLFNGSLSLRIPIGPSYPVSSSLSYGLELVYGSSVWKHAEELDSGGNLVTTATPDRFANAGLGWFMSLGELIDPDDPIAGSGEWVYVDGGGGSHVFYKDPKEGLPDGESDVWYTRDGSYLRMKKLFGGNTAREIEFPDGNRRVFTTTGSCQDCWVLREIRTVYDGAALVGTPSVRIVRDQSNPSDTIPAGECTASGPWDNRWWIEDAHGRSHCVYLNSHIHVGNSVERVELAGPDGDPLVYQLSYQEVVRPRSCKDTNPDTSLSMTLPFLTEMQQPDGTTYDFRDGSQPAYNPDCGQGQAGDASGQLYRVQLPTLGFVEWTWGERKFPVGGPSYLDETSGVVRRTLKDRDGDVVTDANGDEAVWHYSGSLKKVNGANKANEIRVHVTGPAGECTKNFFAADPDLNKVEWTGWEYGLPHTLEAGSEWYENGSALSRQIWDSNDGDPEAPSCTGTKVRSTYVSYQHDKLPNSEQDEDKPRWYASNRRVHKTYTKFHDDGNRFIETEQLDFDGLGNYRQSVLRTNFRQFGDPAEYLSERSFNRTDQTYELNASNQVIGSYTALDVDEPWILGIYEDTESTADDDELAGHRFMRAESSFDRDTGWLECSRVLLGTGTETSASEIARGNADVLALFGADAAGNVTDADLDGGDLDALGTQSICSGSPNPRFKLGSDYQLGVPVERRSSGIQSDGADSPERTLVTRTLDPHTGWTDLITNENGVTTDIEYDDAGRLETATSGGAVTAEWTFVNASGSSPAKRTVLVRSSGGETLRETELEFDDFGRPVLSRVRVPGGGWTEQTTTYDAAGRIATLSSPQAPSEVVQYLDRDTFGRAQRIVVPKDKEVLYSYSGVRKAVKTVTVATASDASGPVETAVVKESYFDGLGRQYRTVEYPDPDDQETDAIVTDYEYDVADRLSLVVIEAPDGTIQTRHFDYDRRGFLIEEVHPELGAPTWAGSVCRSSFDASGKPRSIVTGSLGCAQPSGPSNLQLVLDAWGRLESLLDASQGLRPIKELTYDTAPGLGAGKLHRSVRHNYLVLPWLPSVESDVTVTESWDYSGFQGSPSVRDTEVVTPGRTFEFTQSWQYNDWGGREAIDYPSLCQGSPNCPFFEPVRSVEMSYDVSLPSELTQTLNGLASSWTAAPVEYHANGQPAAIHHANGITDVRELWESDDWIGRPKRLSTEGAVDDQGLDADWSSGIYRFDDDGNLKERGDTDFLYDGVGRITQGGVYQVYQHYTYDAFGNLTEILKTFDGNTLEVRPFAVASDSNRLTTASYDTAGRMTASGSLSMTYDAVGQIAQENGGARTFYYTAADQRIGSASWDAGAGEVTERKFTIRDLTNRALRDYRATSASDADWKVEADYIWGPTGLFAMEHRVKGTHHVHKDHLGSPRLLTDENGVKIGEHQYFPYGEEYQPETFADGVPFQFTGHERDRNGAGVIDDLDYMHARFYSPHLARFTRPDPVYGVVGDSQSWNRYMYVRGNPMSFSDPGGRSLEVTWPEGAGAWNAGVISFGIGGVLAALYGAPPIALGGLALGGAGLLDAMWQDYNEESFQEFLDRDIGAKHLVTGPEDFADAVTCVRSGMSRGCTDGDAPGGDGGGDDGGDDGDDGGGDDDGELTHLCTDCDGPGYVPPDDDDDVCITEVNGVCWDGNYRGGYGPKGPFGDAPRPLDDAPNPFGWGYGFDGKEKHWNRVCSWSDWSDEVTCTWTIF